LTQLDFEAIKADEAGYIKNAGFTFGNIAANVNSVPAVEYFVQLCPRIQLSIKYFMHT
jgi:hypothetical protein